MSKNDLRRELLPLKREQLIDIILDAYSARKEIKSYFDFFVDPDVDKLAERYQKDIAKELSRSKWGRSKARISTINKLLKDFQSYNPGDEHVLSLYIYALEMLLLAEYQLTFTNTLYNGIRKLAAKILEMADSQGEGSRAIEKFSGIIDPDTVGYSRIGKRMIRETLESYEPAKQLKS